ncbi:hypothetical protein C492_09425 [Natronococcus jeotgali DSM 18795]|uniref:Uncharacterized protein n=1 Tax=Natronococcus jeotgali DSM 18795 TaxID=1227498 RepID=L9XIW4_9EURY|nr:hypothetical protein C492_09425 [Natronococcus jeotgali DSM 18795]
MDVSTSDFVTSGIREATAFSGNLLRKAAFIEVGKYESNGSTGNRVPAPLHPFDESNTTDRLVFSDKPQEIVRSAIERIGHQSLLSAPTK